MWAVKRNSAPAAHTPGCTSEDFGPNTVFLSLIPWVVAHAVQEADIHAALIASTAAAGVIVLFGLILTALNCRRIPVHLLDVTLLLVLVVQLGVSYQDKDEITRCFNFITNAALAGLSMVSVLCRYPFTIQYIREALPRDAWRHPLVLEGAYITTSVFVVVFTLNTMLYLVPVAQDVWWDRLHPLTAVFKVLLPCVFYFLAVLITRIWPVRIRQHLRDSQGFDCVEGTGPSKV